MHFKIGLTFEGRGGASRKQEIEQGLQDVPLLVPTYLSQTKKKCVNKPMVVDINTLHI
jgi:hypothetical protein